MKSKTLSEHGEKIERALQEAVADAIEAHRRAGKPIVVARDGKPVRVDPHTIKTVREEQAEYSTQKRPVTSANE